MVPAQGEGSDGRSAGDDPVRRDSRDRPHTQEGTLGAVSNMIDENLRLFRAGAAALVVGSAMTVGVLLYRRGVHGYTCPSQVPVSVFERRARIRVRVAKVTAAPAPGASTSSYVARPLTGRADPFAAHVGRAAAGDREPRHRPPSDEHITLVRRVLRLRPRSLFSGATSDSATFTIRLCGLTAEEEGIALARDELVKPLVAEYCDAELLFREHRLIDMGSTAGGISRSLAGSKQAPSPVAVCHVHRRRGVWWRDFLLPRLDPPVGFADRLLSKGLARQREERWWAADDKLLIRDRETAQTSTSAIQEDSEPIPALKRLVEDRDRLSAAEDSAKNSGSGLWKGSGEVCARGAGTPGVEGRSRWRQIWRTLAAAFRRG